MTEPIGPDARPSGMLRRLLALAVFSMFVGVAAPVAQVYACTCMPLAAGQALANVHVAFTGVVTSVRDANAGNPIIGSADPITYTFAVAEVAKGPAVAEVVLTSPRDGDSCGITFARAEKWRIYANGDGAGGLATSICSGNELLAEDVPIPPLATAPTPGLPTVLLPVGLIVVLVGFSAWAFARGREVRPS
jgi:hypothetical protein